ncbi:hypothetical protein ATK17_3509 [Branchiibius hedensis]|uniref:Uncharacterized protein n=1 Tax=Branchiibius hedensis TaxID=672460 RepID=A0A2Y9A0U4_9MICO|nr:hypothetical protein [Branchiibius hedensis]PWJ27318.1 hypothetical protein ATK17_3509 [Branchiibius hedensis]SSA36129.1 hypothetical protein SAMN04489750_3509 [Branchiibius hedensis]
MPKIQILLDAQGAVLGTASSGAATDGGPVAQLVAAEGQRIVEATLTDAQARLAAPALLKVLSAQRLS